MTTQEAIPTAIKALIDSMPDLPADVPVTCRQSKELENDIDAALDKLGICIHILPVKNLRALQGAQDMVIIEEAEFRIRIFDLPIMNDTGVDHAALAGRVILRLNNTNPGDLLAEPMYPAPVPEEEQGVYDEDTDRTSILHDVIMRGSYPLLTLEEEPTP